MNIKSPIPRTGDGFLDFTEVSVDTSGDEPRVMIEISNTLINDLVSLRELIGGVEALDGYEADQKIQLVIEGERVSLIVTPKPTITEKRAAARAATEKLAEDIADEMSAAYAAREAKK